MNFLYSVKNMGELSLRFCLSYLIFLQFKFLSSSSKKGHFLTLAVLS